MRRKKHAKKDVEEALCYAETYGWKIEVVGGHAWRKMYCPFNDKACRCGEFCISSIWSTPRNTGNHAKQIKRIVDNCAARKTDSAEQFMKAFEFTVKFSLPDSGHDPQEYIEALAEAGCDDAIIGIGQKGRVALQFTREAKDAFSAVTSAIEDVMHAVPGAKLVESTPDLVGLTDVAELIGVTRQYLRKLEITKMNFPQPVHCGKVSLWHLSNVLQWYEVAQQRQVDATIKDIASVNMQINIAKEWAQLDRDSQSKISSLAL